MSEIKKIRKQAWALIGFITALGIVFGDYYQDRFLFCLKPDANPLEIQRTADGAVVDNPQVAQFFYKNDILDVERWITSAGPEDHDGDIYLNRIYRVYLKPGRQDEMESVKESIRYLDVVHSSEFENIRTPVYSPNDPSYWQQTSLPAVKANQAWDFWNISEGEMPGSREVLIAVVDTGVDYTHPDLQENAWINQGEVPGTVFNTIDIDGDDYVTASEVLTYLTVNNYDYNNDGEINLRDALHASSMLTNNADNDNNGKADDIIGWDLSGWSGTDDNDPFPKEGVPNNSTWAHGTHVAGIASAVTHNSLGLAATAFNASIISVKCSREYQTGEPGVNDGYDGITYAAKAGYYAGTFTIINNSWGGSGYNGYEQSVINTAHDTYGAVIVCAGGNGDDYGGEEYSSHYPSSYNNAISVCAIGASGTWTHWATYHETIDLAAPGNDVLSCIIGGGYESWPGSSMASPNAASCIGLLASFYPDWDNEQLESRIVSAADPFIYDVNTEDYLQGMLGEGMVDAYYAIGGLVFPSIYYMEHMIMMETGDGDPLLNPGESGQLRVTLGNEIGWIDASNVSAELTCDHPGVTITDAEAEYSDIAVGGEAVNLIDPFGFELADDIALGDIEFVLHVTATGIPGYTFTREIPFEVNVSLNQYGWPLDTLVEPINNIEASPVLADVDGNNVAEIIFGDYSGHLYAVNTDGDMVETDLFPFDTGNQIWGSPAAADIDNDGHTEIIQTSKSKMLYVLDPVDNIVQVEFDADQYLMGSPALGNLDADDDLEIVVGGYNSSGYIFAINPDGTAVEGFPYFTDEKVLRGVGLADFNGNGRSDIVYVTEDDRIWLIYDDTTVADGFPFTAGDKFKSAPGILEYNGQKIIVAGCRDNNFYAVNSDGSLRFSIATGSYVNTSPAFAEYDETTGIFFGSEDGYLYGIDPDGNALPGWPIFFGGAVNSSPAVSDLNGDGMPEIMAGDLAGTIGAYSWDGSVFSPFPISMGVGITGSPTVKDSDGDGDLEMLIGSSMFMLNFDIKETGISDGFWNMHRGSSLRTGYSGDIMTGGCGDYISGDVNLDLVLDVLDVVRIVSIIMGTADNVTECEIIIADMNLDTVVDVLDVVIIVNTIMGN